jgi:hypothetical protein
MMSQSCKLKVVLFCIAVLFAASGWAAEESQQTAVGQSSVGTSRSALDMIRDKTSISYYGIYYGPQATDPSNSRRLNEWGKPAGNQFFLNYLSLSYKANKSVLPGITVMSTYSPVRGQDLTLIDPYLRLTDTQFIHTGNWNLYSELREFLPATKASHNAHKLSTLGTFQWLSYNVPGTRLQVGAWAKFYWSVYGSGAAPGADKLGTNYDYQGYLRPQMFYTITPKVSATLYYEMTGNHALGKTATDWYSAGTDVQLGALWTVFNGLMLNPYVQLNTSGNVTPDTTTLGAQIFATIL